VRYYIVQKEGNSDSEFHILNWMELRYIDFIHVMKFMFKM